MWVKARQFNGDVAWLNLALARSIVRAVDDGAAQVEAKTFVEFASDDQFTVVETPEELLAGILAPPVNRSS